MYKLRTRKQRRAAERRAQGIDLEKIAKKMRDNPEKGENMLRRALLIVAQERDWDIREQVVFKPYIVDFCAVNCGLVFEADGVQHLWVSHKLKDQKRDARLAKDYNLKVHRFLNVELRDNFGIVLEKLRSL